MNCKEAILFMHEYLDGDLRGFALVQLNEHLQKCPGCRNHFRQLENTDAFLQSVSKVAAPEGLTARIMQSLPKRPKRKSWMQWVRRHPAASVAAVFFFIMMGSFLSLWNEETELVVKGTDLEKVVIHGNKVIVPAGHTVEGDLLVENGEAQVFGDVKGDLVVIDGSYNLASTARISGKITAINQALDWLWYKIGQWFAVVSR